MGHASSKDDWENPKIFQKNREAPHCSFYPYESLEKALQNNPVSLLIFYLIAQVSVLNISFSTTQNLCNF